MISFTIFEFKIFFRPQLLFDWDLTISNKISTLNYPVPKILSLSWHDAKWLRKILKSTFTVKLLYKINNKLMECSIVDKGHSDVMIRSSHNYVKNSEATVPTIYPTLNIHVES